MKKLTLIFLQVVVLYTLSNAQAIPKWLWGVASSGGDEYQYGSGAAIDDSGFFYMGGRFAPSCTFGTHTINTSAPATQFFGKFDENGNCLWLAQQYYSSGYDYPRGFCIDRAKSNNVYATGNISSGNGMYVVKFGCGGSLQWSTTLGTGGYNGYEYYPNGDGIAADTAGNVYVTGEIGGGNYTFGDSTINYPGTGSSQEMFLTKLDHNGNFLWAVGADGMNSSSDAFDVGRSVALDKAGQYVFVGGGYYGAVSFHSRNPSLYPDILPTPQSGPNSTLFIAKYDTAGDLIWVTIAPGAGIPWTGSTFISSVGASNSLAIDSCGDVYVTSSYSGSATFGPFTLTASSSTNDGFLASCNSLGQWQWADDISVSSSTYQSYGSSVALDKDNDVYIGGGFTGTADFGSGVSATATSSSSAFIAKFANSNGAAQWVLTPTGSGATGGGSVAIDTQKHVYFTGSFSGNITIGSDNLTYTGGYGQGIYIAKLDTASPRYIVPTVDSSYCPGEKIALPYTTIGTFNNGNTFTAELSDSTGSFVNYTVIGDTLSDTSGNIIITIPGNITPGSTYLIRVVSDSPTTSSYVNGCGAYYQQNVYVNDFYIKIGTGRTVTPIITPSPANDSICTGASITLTASGGSSYTWSNGDTGSVIIVSPAIDSVFTVTAKGACGSGSVSDTVTVNPAQPFNITPNDTGFCSGQQGTLYVAGGGSNFIWTPTSGIIDSSLTNDSSVTVSPTVTTTYMVTGINASGCATSGVTTITIIPSPIKPSFSQDGDTLISSSNYDNVWYFNGTLLTDTSDKLIITVPGEYWVVVTNEVNGCSTPSDSMYIDTASGIDRLSSITNQLSVYPNPFNNTIFIKISSSAENVQNWSLQITDVLGRTLYGLRSLNYSNDFDLSGLACGVYFITITDTNNNRAVFPIVKQN